MEFHGVSYLHSHDGLNNYFFDGFAVTSIVPSGVSVEPSSSPSLILNFKVIGVFSTVKYKVSVSASNSILGTVIACP